MMNHRTLTILLGLGLTACGGAGPTDQAPELGNVSRTAPSVPSATATTPVPSTVTEPTEAGTAMVLDAGAVAIDTGISDPILPDAGAPETSTDVDAGDAGSPIAMGDAALDSPADTGTDGGTPDAAPVFTPLTVLCGGMLTGNGPDLNWSYGSPTSSYVNTIKGGPGQVCGWYSGEPEQTCVPCDLAPNDAGVMGDQCAVQVRTYSTSSKAYLTMAYESTTGGVHISYYVLGAFVKDWHVPCN